MDESARNRSSMTSAELEVVLGRIAAIEHEETLGPEDLLDFVEGKASRAQTDAVHHALARSASLRTELFGFLEELGAFDIESLTALVTKAGARPGLSFERVNETPRAPLGAGDAGRGMTRLPFRRNNWGWLLAAAAVLVVMVRPFGSEAPSPTDEAGAMTVVAATRAFDPDSGQGFIIRCGFFCAKRLTAAAGRRSELPSRKTGLTAEPSTLAKRSRRVFSAAVFGPSGKSGMS